MEGKTQLSNVNIQSPKSQECETWRSPKLDQPIFFQKAYKKESKKKMEERGIKTRESKNEERVGLLNSHGILNKERINTKGRCPDRFTESEGSPQHFWHSLLGSRMPATQLLVLYEIRSQLVLSVGILSCFRSQELSL